MGQTLLQILGVNRDAAGHLTGQVDQLLWWNGFVLLVVDVIEARHCSAGAHIGHAVRRRGHFAVNWVLPFVVVLRQKKQLTQHDKKNIYKKRESSFQ